MAKSPLLAKQNLKKVLKKSTEKYGLVLIQNRGGGGAWPEIEK